YQDLRTGYVLRQVDALREMGNLEAAYETLAPVLAQQPQDPRTIAALARLYAAAGDHRQALALYQQQLQLAPGDVDTMIAAAGSAAAARDLSTAEHYLEQALARAPQNPEVLAGAGRVYRAAGKSRKAERYFQAALAAQGRSAGQPGGLGGTGAMLAARHSSNPFAGLTGQGRSTGFAVAPPAQGMALPAPAAPLLATSAPVVVPASAAYVDTPAAGTLARADDLPPPAAARAQAGAPMLALPVPNQPLPASEPPRPSLATAARPSLASTGNPVLDELRELQSETSSQTGVAAAYRTRDGEAGLGQLDDLQVPMEGRF